MKRRLFFVLAAGAAAPACAYAEAPPELSGVVVVGRAPLSGAEAAAQQATGAVTVISEEDLPRTGGSRLLEALERQAPGVSLMNQQGNAFQPDVVYRGFEASPLQGVAQGLAVYVDGVRLNSPFGETVNWDFVPEAAVRSITLQGSDPTFGLNALGGSLAVRLKTGFEDPDGELELSGGDYGRRKAELQWGRASDHFATFLAATAFHDDGWRRFSPSDVRQLYGDLAFRNDRWKVDLGLTAVDNSLTGNGPAPVELLAADRRAVFTHPDTTKNRFAQARLAVSYEASSLISLQGQLYASRLRQRTVNGDATDAEPCADDDDVLCLEADGPLLTDPAGAAIAAFNGEGPYAVLNTTRTRTDRWGAAVQVVSYAPIGRMANDLAAGLSYDAGDTAFSAATLIGPMTPDRGFGGSGILIDQADGPIAPLGLTARTGYLGIYATDTAHLTPALAVTFSGRFDQAELKLRDQFGTALTGDHRFDRFNPAVGATYQLTPEITAYAGWASASRTPTPAELSCADPTAPCTLTDFFVADPELKLVTADTFEAGMRGAHSWGAAKLSWSAGLFRTTTHDDILRVASEVRGRGFFQNVGETRRQGVEARADWRRGRWRAFVTYALTDATFDTPLVLTSPDNPAADAEGRIQVEPGDRLPGVARHRVKVGLAYRTERWRLGLDAAAASGVYLTGDEANLQPRTDGYVVANLSAAWSLTRRIELFGTIENLADARYETAGAFAETSAVFLAEAPGAANPRSLTPGAPRTFEVGLRLSF
jgi:outer membrane receptor protein involved in Fe transport